jgi:pyruvate/2-oxoglutarate dehydrogenase complex dihydrolipoamide acyltransferase (E2) component
MKGVVLQRLGMQILQARITRWYKSEGDMVEEREPLYDVESKMGKITMRSLLSGRISEILVKEGDIADIGSIIAYIDGA